MNADTNFESILIRLNGLERSLSKLLNEMRDQIDEIAHIGYDLELEGYLDDADISFTAACRNIREAREYVEKQKKIKDGYNLFTVNGVAIRYRTAKDIPDGCIVVFRSSGWRYLGNLPIHKDDEKFPNPDSLEESVRHAAEMGLLPELAKECNIAETKTGGE